MYQYLKSVLNWNPISIKIAWSLLVASCIIFWYYSFQAFDFVVQYVTKFMFSL